MTAPNKSRVTCNMWREDYSSSLVLELKLLMQHLLNINDLNYVVFLVANQMQSGAPSDLSSSTSFALKCVCSVSVYGNGNKKLFHLFFISKLFFVAPRIGKLGSAGISQIMGLFLGIVCVILT